MASQPVRHWHYANGNARWQLRKKHQKKLKGLMVKPAGKVTHMQEPRTAKTSVSKPKNKPPNYLLKK